MFHLDPAIDGDRMVDRSQHRKSRSFDGQEAVSQALVVLHEVEVVHPVSEVVPGA